MKNKVKNLGTSFANFVNKPFNSYIVSHYKAGKYHYSNMVNLSMAKRIANNWESRGFKKVEIVNYKKGKIRKF